MQLATNPLITDAKRAHNREKRKRRNDGNKVARLMEKTEVDGKTGEGREWKTKEEKTEERALMGCHCRQLSCWS